MLGPGNLVSQGQRSHECLRRTYNYHFTKQAQTLTAFSIFILVLTDRCSSVPSLGKLLCVTDDNHCRRPQRITVPQKSETETYKQFTNMMNNKDPNIYMRQNIYKKYHCFVLVICCWHGAYHLANVIPGSVPKGNEFS